MRCVMSGAPTALRTGSDKVRIPQSWRAPGVFDQTPGVTRWVNRTAEAEPSEGVTQSTTRLRSHQVCDVP